MSYRKEKIEGQIRRILSELIIKEIKDPRIGFLSITEIDLSKDYSNARIGISVLGTKKEMRNSLAGINSAKGFLQFKLGKSLHIRKMPKLSFYLDSSIADSVDMVNLLESLNKESEENENSEEQDE